MADKIQIWIVTFRQYPPHQLDHIVTLLISIDIVERLEVVQIAVAGGKLCLDLKQAIDVFADGHIARQLGQWIGIFRGIYLELGDFRHQVMAGTYTHILALLRQDKAVGQLPRVGLDHDVAEILDADVHFNHHRLGVHQVCAGFPAVQFPPIMVGIALDYGVAADDSARDAIGDHRNGLQFRRSGENFKHLVIRSA